MPTEAIADGPAGTGKTFGILTAIHALCENYPGVRVLILRKTRTSLSESALQIYEDHVLGYGHPVLAGNQKRSHRQKYEYPNGSQIVLGGMDNPEKLFSTEYDLAYVNEAKELSLAEWESLHRALRHRGWTPQGAKKPAHLLLGDTNPDSPYHWILQRFNQGKCTRIKTHHWDNPMMEEEYLQRLRENTSGARFAWLYLGEWTGAEGLVWDTYDSALHLIAGELRSHDEHPDRKWLFLPSMNPAIPKQVVELRWFIAGMDFGYEAPGSFVVWGFDEGQRAYKVAELYHSKWTIEDWAEPIARLYERFQFVRIVCDSAEPGKIQYLNDHVGPLAGRELPRIAVPCKKGPGSVAAGIDLVRTLFKSNQVFLVRDTLIGVDRECAERGAPVSLEQEVLGWTYRQMTDASGQPEERPDPRCADHACMATVYALRSAWQTDFSTNAPQKDYAPGTLGAIFGDPESLARERELRRRRDRLDINV